MNFTIFDRPADFQARTWPFLLQHEAENNLMIGIVAALIAGKADFMDPAKRPLLCTVEGGDGVLAAAVMTPPFRMNLTRGPGVAMDSLAEHLHARGISLPGVNGPCESAQTFAAAWNRLTGQPTQRNRGLRIYQLDHVTPAPRAAGSLCQVTPADLDLIVGWVRAFFADCHLDNPPTAEGVARRIDNRAYFLWKSPHPVSMACATGPTPAGIRIGAVYTPPALRNRGYASALVAALSQYQLDSGRRFCFLFTDMANPTSNSIYQKIGYRPVCDFEEHDFASA
jgi:hypothetical protein